MHYELSFWEYDTFLKRLDVVVLGSGIVGLSAAVRLKELAPSLHVAIWERGPLPIGASTRNAGFACFGSMSELLDDLQHQPEDAVWHLVEKRWHGLQRLRSRLGDAALGYEGLGGYEIFTQANEHSYEYCLEHLSTFNQIASAITGHPQTWQIADTNASYLKLGKVRHIIANTLEGQLHTGRMMQAWMRLAQEKGVVLMNGIDVTHILPDTDGVVLQAAAGWSIKVPLVLVCVNGFARALLPELAVFPARNQVLITQPVSNLCLRGAFHYDRGYFYFRNVGPDRILLGGGRNLAPEEEATAEFGTTPLIQEALLDLLRNVILPGHKVEIAQCWSGILGVGTEKKPIVQRLHERLAVAVRMGGMGVAIGTLVGEEGACLLLDSA